MYTDKTIWSRGVCVVRGSRNLFVLISIRAPLPSLIIHLSREARTLALNLGCLWFLCIENPSLSFQFHRNGHTFVPLEPGKVELVLTSRKNFCLHPIFAAISWVCAKFVRICASQHSWSSTRLFSHKAFHWQQTEPILYGHNSKVGTQFVLELRR